MKRTFGILAVLTLLLSACGPIPTTAPSPSPPSPTLPPEPTPTTAPSPSPPSPTPPPEPTPTIAPSPPTTPSLPLPSPTPPPEPNPYPDELHLLVGIKGKVELKRLAWSDYQSATFGARLYRGDLLLPDGWATVLCANLSLRQVRAESGVPCPVQEPVVIWREESAVVTPRGPNALIPYILHPRRTKVLTPRPWLRWHDTGAASYTVVVRSGRQKWKQEGVTGSEMLYPSDAPPLKPGVNYLLVVMDEDSKRSSTEDPRKGLGFSVLSYEERATVEAQAAEIEALELDEPTRRFVLATYYTGQELRGEALVLLDELSGTLDTPAVYLWRGDLLREMALSDTAMAAYQVALERAEALGDLESQATAHAALWRLTGDETHLDRAVEVHEELGAKAQAEALRKEKGQ